MGNFQWTRKPNYNNINKLDYNLYWGERGFEINKKLKEREEIILNIIPDQARVLDIGCGNSLLPLKLKEKNCNIEIVDISDEVLAGFEKMGIGGRILDIEKDLDGINDNYDYIILSEVLEHVRFPEAVVDKLKNKSKFLIITIPNSAFYRYRIGLLLNGRFFTQWVYHPAEHLRFWSHIDFLDWLDSLGVEVIASQASNGLSLFGIKLFDFAPNLFGHQIIYHCRKKLSKS